ncbi:hypothetical protein GYMLUDRAFT_713507 [Collybiopsis luxurians FD-317 M1]|nr:hypothetical protein GYMLUDRAFT_713507 [Collybiopsis luxurians FD-317 M1]
MDPDATNLRSPPKLKPLIIPEQSSVALGLLTPVDESADDEESTNGKFIRPLPVPKNESGTIHRPRASSWATWTAGADSSSFTIQSETLLSTPSAHSAPTHSHRNISLTSGKSRPVSENRSQKFSKNDGNSRLSPHHSISDTGTREGRSATVSYISEARPVSTGRKSSSKLPNYRSSLPSPPEHHFASRARANTSAAVPKHQVQNWLASPTVNPSRVASPFTEVRTADAQPKLLGPKIKALPHIPVTSNCEALEPDKMERTAPLTAKDKGKGRATDVILESDSSNGGLVTPPDSAQTPAGPSPNTSPLSGPRGTRPRGPRTRSSTIC